MTERTMSLPGGVNVTFRTGGQVWSYPSLHGDVAAVANASGVKQGATTVWDPWGDLVTGVLADNSASNWDYGWHGQQTMPIDHSPGLTATIEMGARQYLPQLGRFIEVDPVEGCTPNSCLYVSDPANSSDLTGMSCLTGVDHVDKKGKEHCNGESFTDKVRKFAKGVADYGGLSSIMLVAGCALATAATAGAAAAICLASTYATYLTVGAHLTVAATHAVEGNY